MNVERKAKCEECANADFCKYTNNFLSGAEKIKAIAAEMGKGTDITISCRYANKEAKEFAEVGK